MLLLYQDKVLLVNNWLGAGKWNLPGGGLHKGEDPREGLLREVFEETGIRLEADMVRPLAEEIYRIHGFRYHCHYFTAEVDTKPPTVVQRSEIVELTWLNRSDISPKTCGPDVIRALELAQLLDRVQPL
jgi:8-oxo-dGTP pyrophosphatase MutT (NUDIX family)